MMKKLHYSHQSKNEWLIEMVPIPRSGSDHDLQKCQDTVDPMDQDVPIVSLVNPGVKDQSPIEDCDEQTGGNAQVAQKPGCFV